MGEPFGSVLREFRLAAGLSQEALADRASLSAAAISTLERSARRAPQRQTIALLAEGLRLSPEDRSRLEAVAASFRPRGPRNGASPRRAPPNNIPCSLTSFYGRGSELHELQDLLRSRRLITLVGAGGVGKTRLAIETARDCLSECRFDDGVFLVDFSTFTDPVFLASSIAAVFGIAERSTQMVLETLATAIRTKSALLIFDNCEHVIDEAAKVAEYLLQRCASVRILATSREALRLDGERLVHLEPLVVEDSIDTPAVQLFLDRVQDSDVKNLAVLSATDRALVLKICARLDGLPLALELAAARAGDMSLSSIAERIDERFALLDHGRRTAAERQRTMRGAIDWSYLLLADGEKRLLRKLGIFAGSSRAKRQSRFAKKEAGRCATLSPHSS